MVRACSSPANVVVIGGTGFIGSRLVSLLEQEGSSVAVMSRRPGARYQGSVNDPGSLERCTRGASVVFHLATGGGDNWADFERDFLDGARNVAAACRANGVQRLVYTSSIAALYLGGQAIEDERCGLDPRIQERSFYARAKAGAEIILRNSGVPVIIVRPGVVVGAGGLVQHTGVGYWPSNTCCLGWGSGNYPLPFVLVDDVAEALRAAALTPGIEGDAFNLAGDVRLTAREYVAALADRSLRPFRFYPQPLWRLQSMEIGKWLVKTAARRPGLTFPSYRDLQSRSLRATLDSTRAKEVLGWRPNADLSRFYSEAIDRNLRPVPPGDLRLQTWRLA